MTQRLPHDISDNASRGTLLAGLIQAASGGAPRCLDAWKSDVEHAEPPSAQEAVGAMWKLSNDLRIMSQYGRVLRDACLHSYFLLGAPVTCVERLEWFHSFAQPTRPLCAQALQSLQAYLVPSAQHGGHAPDLKEAAFHAHRAIMKPERQLTQFLVEQHFPGPHKEYELDVCAYMLARQGLTYREWQESFPSWRLAGLYYPLALASVYMPDLGAWLPSEVHATRVGAALSDCLESLRRPAADHSQPLTALVEAWKHDASGTSDVLSSILDRLAILMGVKSNGGPFQLSEALQAFASTFPVAEQGDAAQAIHGQNYEAWHRLKAAVESTFPPSLLAAPLVRPKRETWGYPRLTLEVDLQGPVPALSFQERALVHVKPASAPLAQSLAHTYHPPFVKECMLHQTSQRLQDALWRLGEIATSAGVSICMLRPDLALASIASLEMPDAHAHLAGKLGEELSVGGILAKMEAKKPADAEQAKTIKECYEAYTAALDDVIPQPRMHYLPEERTVLMWRLDTPPRAILYVGPGEGVSLRSGSTHHLEKVMVNAKVQRRPIGGILAAPLHASVDVLRDTLRCFARDGLSTHPANTVLLAQADPDAARQAKPTVAPVTCTTLAESVACFALTSPPSTTVRKIGESCSWKEDGIDPRYAEKQVAENGYRYRDWMALHVDKQGTQQSRLAAHAVTYDCLYTTVMPWYLEQGGIEWVQVSSTLHPESRTLHGRSLRHAVESRFLHDLRMLPAADGERVHRSNCEIYTDASGSVGVAYFPEKSERLHFICFHCKGQEDGGKKEY